MVSSTAAGGVVRALADGSLLQRSCAACFLTVRKLAAVLLCFQRSSPVKINTTVWYSGATFISFMIIIESGYRSGKLQIPLRFSKNLQQF
jgi:hypothetical protein